MTSLIRRLLKDSFIYGLGSFASKGITFLTLPIYTRLFLPAEYGYIESLLIMGNLLAAFIIMGMDSALSMFYFKHKNEGILVQKEIISSVLQWRIISGAMLLLLVILCSPMINQKIFLMGLTPTTISIAFIGTFFTQLLGQCAEVMRLMFRPYQYLSVMVGQAVGAALLSVLFIYKFGMGIQGYFIGIIIAGIATSTFGLFSLRGVLNFSRLYVDWWIILLKFGLPLLPAGLSMYVISTADRWFILHYHGSEPLGYFAVAAKFSMIITLLVEAFRTAWWPHAMECLYDEKLHGIFDKVSRTYLIFGVLMILFLTLASSTLITIIAGQNYYKSWTIVGILAWQPFFYGYYLICSLGVWKSEKTYLTLIITTTAAIVGILLNLALVPKYGGNGAAFATAITYFLWIIVNFQVSSRLLDLKIDKVFFYALICIGFSAVYAMIFTFEDEAHLFNAVVVTVACLVIFLATYLRPSAYPKEENR